MIPKIIHFCWYGRGEYNDVIKKCIMSWEKKLPNYTIKKWDETNTPFEELPFLKLLYKQKKWSFITDYIRLFSLYTEGGIYLDTDIEVLTSFDSLLSEKAFVGFQTNLEDSKYPLNSAVIGAVKNDPFILDCIRETERKQRLKFNAMGGPPIVSKVLYGYGLTQYKKQYLKDVLLLPKEYFFPFSWDEQYTEDCIQKDTICIHWWEDSWSNKKKGFSYYVDSLKRKVQKTPLLLKDTILFIIVKKNFYHFKDLQ